MIFADFKDFIAALPPVGRLLGIDWGARRIGFAVSDDNREFTFPRENLKSKDIAEIIGSEKIVGIVIGLPTHADGTDSDTTVKVHEFTAELAALTNLPIVFMDEQLTSVEARDRTGGQRIDAHAAAVILEDAIAKIKRTGK